MTYSEKLQDPRWQKKRLEILSRDNFTCQHCFDHQSKLVVHHFYYIQHRHPWDYPNKSLVTLCDQCHSIAHEDSHILSMFNAWEISASRHISLSCYAHAVHHPDQRGVTAMISIAAKKAGLDENETLIMVEKACDLGLIDAQWFDDLSKLVQLKEKKQEVEK